MPKKIQMLYCRCGAGGASEKFGIILSGAKRRNNCEGYIIQRKTTEKELVRDFGSRLQPSFEVETFRMQTSSK